MAIYIEEAVPDGFATTIRGPVCPDYLAGNASLLRLVHRRTGQPMLIEGACLHVFTSDPELAAQQLLRRHSPRDWMVQTERLGVMATRPGGHTS